MTAAGSSLEREKEKGRWGERVMRSNIRSSAGPCLIGRQAWNIARKEKIDSNSN